MLAMQVIPASSPLQRWPIGMAFAHSGQPRCGGRRTGTDSDTIHAVHTSYVARLLCGFSDNTHPNTFRLPRGEGVQVRETGPSAIWICKYRDAHRQMTLPPLPSFIWPRWVCVSCQVFLFCLADHCQCYFKLDWEDPCGDRHPCGGYKLLCSGYKSSLPRINRFSAYLLSIATRL